MLEGLHRNPMSIAIPQRVHCPGRVATLVHREDWDKISGSDVLPDEDVAWGVAYTIHPVYVVEVRDYLDYREKDGYMLETLDIYNVDANGDDRVVIYNVGLRTQSCFLRSIADLASSRLIAMLAATTIHPSADRTSRM
ncbi:hypothetical protein BKA70DRAFT_1566641 [Coprinopsis sp. MPI-PUGE-AT-0042]|nr:hypothetical protein BKA70DRAFT_1566641 [Coprinopsis sp. MPI-PUGE-AT-0042]